MLNTTFTEIQTKYATGERNFQNLQLSKVNLRGVTLKGVNLHGADLSCADLRDADLTDSDLRKCNLKGADLRGSILNGVQFDSADLSGANLNGAKLIKAHFRKAKLCSTYLTKANLEGAYLVEADLNKASLNNANLANSNLKKANLMGAFLLATNLSNVFLSEANLCDTILNGATIDNTHFKGAVYSEKSRFPMGFEPEQFGMKKESLITVAQLIETLNTLTQKSNHYLGATITAKYLEKARPGCEWLTNFTIEKNGSISFVGSLTQIVGQMELKWYQQWVKEFVNSCSNIIHGFENVVEENQIIPFPTQPATLAA